jgi:hypothetical protein
LDDGGWLIPRARLVMAQAKTAAFKQPENFAELERPIDDDTKLVFLREPSSLFPHKEADA